MIKQMNELSPTNLTCTFPNAQRFSRHYRSTTACRHPDGQQERRQLMHEEESYLCESRLHARSHGSALRNATMAQKPFAQCSRLAIRRLPDGHPWLHCSHGCHLVHRAPGRAFRSLGCTERLKMISWNQQRAVARATRRLLGNGLVAMQTPH